MEIYLDYEKTLTNEQNQISDFALNTLKALAKLHMITILTASPLQEITQRIHIPKLRIVSTLENACLYQEMLTYETLDYKLLNPILEDEAIYTAYTIAGETYVFNYRERLKSFYPNRYLKLKQQLDFNPSFLILAVKNEAFSRINTALKSYTLEVLAVDKNRTLCKVTAAPSTKEDWLLKLKKSPAIGIGDSQEDYDFIQHCEVKVAMKNAPSSLKALCEKETFSTNQEDGAIHFILSVLKHPQA